MLSRTKPTKPLLVRAKGARYLHLFDHLGLGSCISNDRSDSRNENNACNLGLCDQPTVERILVNGRQRRSHRNVLRENPQGFSPKLLKRVRPPNVRGTNINLALHRLEDNFPKANNAKHILALQNRSSHSPG